MKTNGDVVHLGKQRPKTRSDLNIYIKSRQNILYIYTYIVRIQSIPPYRTAYIQNIQMKISTEKMKKSK